MTTADRKLIDEAILRHGNCWWSDLKGWEHRPDQLPPQKWIIIELLEILAKDDLDLKVIRKSKVRNK